MVPVAVKAIPRLTVSEPLIAVSAIAAAVAPFVVPVPFVELSLPVMTKSSAITGAARARQTKADVPRRRELRDLEMTEMACDMVRPLSFMVKKVSPVQSFSIRSEL